MSLLLGLIATLAEVLRVLFEDFDSFLEDLVVFGSSILAWVELMHLVIVQLNFASKVLAPSFKGSNLVFELGIFEFQFWRPIPKLL